MKPYQISDLFSRLKATEENLQGNWTSGQYAEVLDRLLYESVSPIIRDSAFIDLWMASILSWYSNGTRRKISSVGKLKLQTLMVMFLATPDHIQKMKLLKQMRLERSLLVLAVNNWLLATTEYTKLVGRMCGDNPCDAAVHVKRIDNTVCASRDLYPAINTVGSWITQYLTFRDWLVEKYTRLSLLRAKAVYVASGHRVDLDEAIQIHLTAVTKAIDKYDVSKGALTSYIQVWFKDAVNRCWETVSDSVSWEGMLDDGHEPIDTDTLEESIVSRSNINRVKSLVSAIDDTGLGRIYLGIETL